MKKILRKKLLKKRKKNYVEISSKHNLNIYKVLKKNYQNIKTIGGYVPINYEFDCLKLLQLLEKKKLYHMLASYR